MIVAPQSLWLVLAVAATAGTATNKNVTISSTISNNQSVCPGEQLNFTCVTRGSSIIAWLSDDYIGASRWEFSAADHIGTTMMPFGPNTVATLVNVQNVNGIRVLISQLMITVSSDYQNPSVTCLHVGCLINTTISFPLLAVPGTVLEAYAIAHELPGMSEGCMVYTHWHKPNNTARNDINHYIISYSIESQLRAAANDHSKVFSLPRCNFQSITITAVDKCGREGLPVVIPIQRVSVNDNATTTITTNEATSGQVLINDSGGSRPSTFSTVNYIIVVIFAVVAGLFISAAVFLICYAYRKYKKKERKVEVSELKINKQ